MRSSGSLSSGGLKAYWSTNSGYWFSLFACYCTTRPDARDFRTFCRRCLSFGTFTKTFTKPAILDPTTGMIHIINSFEYIEYDDEFRNNFKNLVVKGLKMNEATVYSLAHLWAYKMSYSHCDTINYNSKVKSLGNTGAKYINIPEIVKLSINANIAKRELENAIAREALKKEKMPAIIEWVKNNTDKKTDEDIKNLAEHIFNKKY